MTQTTPGGADRRVQLIMDDLPLLQQFQKYAPALRVLLEEPGFDLATTLIAAVPNNEVLIAIYS